jgi:hypothetical protein
MDNDIEIFKGKNFSGLCEDIYNNSKTNRNQVEILITELRSLVKGLNDAIIIVPLIKDYLDVAVRNDDQLVKLAAIVQRIMNRQSVAAEDSFQLTDEERTQLQGVIDEIGGRVEMDVSDIVSDARKKLD